MMLSDLAADVLQEDALCAFMGKKGLQRTERG